MQISKSIPRELSFEGDKQAIFARTGNLGRAFEIVRSRRTTHGTAVKYVTGND